MKRIIIEDSVVLPDGNLIKRSSHDDFRTLSKRHIDKLYSVSGFQGEIEKWVDIGCGAYNKGEYEVALRYLKLGINALPALYECLFYYVRICERVLSVPPTADERAYEDALLRYSMRPRWYRRLFNSGFQIKLRCKWCGRLTRYVHPDTPTYGLVVSANSCWSCGTMYPMPSWLWDSPDGRAYSYYRHSFTNPAFYSEFEADFDPRPPMGKSAEGRWAPVSA